MRKLLTLLAFSMLLVAPRAFAQTVANSFDPCATFPKTTVAINIATATDTQLVAAVTGSPVYVCGMVLNQVNGTGSFGLEYGTGASCATGKTALTGTLFAATTASGTTNVVRNATKEKGSMAVAPMSNALCAISTGTIQQSGWLTYVQRPDVTAASSFDPCTQYPTSAAAINSSAASAAQIIAGVANTNTYICEMYYQDAGRASTANTAQFSYGTGTTCGTGNVVLGGALSGGLTAGANSTTINVAGTSTQFTLPQGTSFCITPTQTSTIEGYVTYVQR